MSTNTKKSLQELYSTFYHKYTTAKTKESKDILSGIFLKEALLCSGDITDGIKYAHVVLDSVYNIMNWTYLPNGTKNDILDVLDNLRASLTDLNVLTYQYAYPFSGLSEHIETYLNNYYALIKLLLKYSDRFIDNDMYSKLVLALHSFGNKGRTIGKYSISPIYIGAVWRLVKAVESLDPKQYTFENEQVLFYKFIGLLQFENIDEYGDVWKEMPSYTFGVDDSEARFGPIRDYIDANTPTLIIADEFNIPCMKRYFMSDNIEYMGGSVFNRLDNLVDRLKDKQNIIMFDCIGMYTKPQQLYLQDEKATILRNINESYSEYINKNPEMMLQQDTPYDGLRNIFMWTSYFRGKASLAQRRIRNSVIELLVSDLKDKNIIAVFDAKHCGKNMVDTDDYLVDTVINPYIEYKIIKLGVRYRNSKFLSTAVNSKVFLPMPRFIQAMCAEPCTEDKSLGIIGNTRKFGLIFDFSNFKGRKVDVSLVINKDDTITNESIHKVEAYIKDCVSMFNEFQFNRYKREAKQLLIAIERSAASISDMFLAAMMVNSKVEFDYAGVVEEKFEDTTGATPCNNASLSEWFVNSILLNGIGNSSDYILRNAWDNMVEPKLSLQYIDSIRRTCKLIGCNWGYVLLNIDICNDYYNV